MPTLKSAHSPRYSDPENKQITLSVLFEEYDGNVGEIPFTATADDCEDYGRDIHARAIAGEFGPIAACVPPSDEVLAAQAQAEKARRMSIATAMIAPLQDAADMGIATPAEETNLLALKQYRVELNRIEQQPGYPSTIAWPEKPA
ncbi:Caudovirales tail fiber assembly protein [compost metagenome]